MPNKDVTLERFFKRNIQCFLMATTHKDLKVRKNMPHVWHVLYIPKFY